MPNRFGGRENLEALDFIRELNDVVHHEQPGAIMIAEESTSWPLVTKGTDQHGLGFDFKWNMGWMHDTLKYFERDPFVRRYFHNNLTFGLTYAWSENFILPFSHDEVVHMKGSMLNKMHGTREQKLANLRALYAYMWAHPGKKLLFMGGEISAVARVERRAQHRLAPARRQRRAPRRQHARRGFESHTPRAARALRIGR